MKQRFVKTAVSVLAALVLFMMSAAVPGVRAAELDPSEDTGVTETVTSETETEAQTEASVNEEQSAEEPAETTVGSAEETEAEQEAGQETEAETTTEEEATTEEETTAYVPVTVDYELDGPDIYGETYCVIDGNTGEILFSKDPHKKMYPASCTKIMTALLVLENVQDLNQTLTFTETAINIDPSSSTLPPKAMVGETMTVRDALYGMLLQSANECGAMLGEFVAGSEAAFADMMNAKAAELGLTGTHFTNAYGIHNDDHYTTAYDLALILRAAMQNERYRTLNATVDYVIPATNMNAARAIRMGHKMINGDVEEAGVIGGKTGSTPQAGRCLATACNRNGMYVITTVMKSTVDNYYPDTQVLLEYTYGILKDHTIAPIEWVETNDFVIPTDNVRVRYSPSMNGAVAGMAYSGTQYVRRGIYGAWSMIEYEGRLLYVASCYLTSTEPGKVPETTEWVYVETTAAPETVTESDTASESGETSMASSEPETTAERRGTIETADPNGSSKKKDPKAIYNALAIICPSVMIVALIGIWIYAFMKRQQAKKEKKRKKKKRRTHF